MKFATCVLLCVLLIDKSYAGVFGIPDPLAAAGNIAGTLNKGAEFVVDGSKSAAGTVAGGVGAGAKGLTDIAYAADRQAVSGSKTVFRRLHNGAFEGVNGVVTGLDEVVGTPVDLKEVSFYLATAKNVKDVKKIDFYHPEEVAKTKGKIYILIHGWMASMNSTWFYDLSKIFTSRDPDAHVVQIDWHNPASDNYAFAAFNTESVGDFVGIFVNRLLSDFKVPRENLVIIGHSLGGQIAGWAGKKLGEISGIKLARIVALDPAGPLFFLRPSTRKLNKHDAENVMVIHSDGDKLGYPTSCGTIDFYPNNGDSQPGCWDLDITKISTYAEPVTCDHSRAWDFFVEAVNHTGSFPARKCDSYSDFKAHKCDNNVVVAMGDISTTERGDFYLKTNDKRPYSRPLPSKDEKDTDIVENNGNPQNTPQLPASDVAKDVISSSTTTAASSGLGLGF